MMNKLLPAFKRFAADINGVTSIEYALVAAIVVIAIASALHAYGAQIGATFDSVANVFLGI